MKSPASGYVSQILKGNETAEDWINKADSILNLEDLAGEASELNSIRSDLSDVLHDSDIGIDADIADWEEILDSISFMEQTVDMLSDETLATTTKFNTAHYAAYNFDCFIKPDGDASITGTDFKSIHGAKSPDSEYIITGIEGNGAVVKVEVLMAHIFILGNMLSDYADEKIRNTMYAIACVISDIIFAISEGTVNIDPRIIQVGLTFYLALVQGIKDVWDIVQGNRATFFGYEDVDMVTMGYRDILYLLALCTPEEDMLERSVEILQRDYGDICTGISLEADFRGHVYTLEKSYQLYQ